MSSEPAESSPDGYAVRREQDPDTDAALHRIAEHQSGYKKLHGDMLAQFGLDRSTLLEAPPAVALQVFLFYYALNRAGSNTAGYPVYAAVSVERDELPDPEAAWSRFVSMCEADDKKPNESRNRGAVEGAVQFAHEEGNVFAWARDELSTGSVADVYERVLDIYGIGEKIGRFFCRDATWLAGAEGEVALEHTPLLHPVDIWIRRASLSLWLDVTTETDDADISRKLASACIVAGASHAAVNQGAWYVSTQETARDVQEAIHGRGGRSDG